MAQRDWADKDFYKVLGVDKSASKDQIKKAYRKLAQQYHPDANKGDKAAEQRFKEISEAHAVLSNDDKRREYDQVRAFVESGGSRFFGFTPGSGSGSVRINIGDLFGDGADVGDMGGLFEDLFGFRGTGPGRGGDLETEATLTFEEAMSGVTLTLESGTKVRIPAGIGDGARIKVSGKGSAGPGGRSGDLYVRVRVAPHPVFKPLGNGNLEVTLPVTFPEAALGAEVEVPTLTGSVRMKVPAGTQNGRVLRVRGKGAPRPKGGHGDLMVKVEVQVPQKLSKKEADALRQFADVHKASPRAHFGDEAKAPRASKAS